MLQFTVLVCGMSDTPFKWMPAWFLWTGMNPGESHSALLDCTSCHCAGLDLCLTHRFPLTFSVLCCGPDRDLFSPPTSRLSPSTAMTESLTAWPRLTESPSLTAAIFSLLCLVMSRRLSDRRPVSGAIIHCREEGRIKAAEKEPMREGSASK